MRMSVKNNGTGFSMIRIEVPDSLTSAFLEFIEFHQAKLRNKTLSIRNSKPLHDEKYFIELNTYCKTSFYSAVASGLSSNQALSSVLKKLKGTNFYNISYDGLKSILTKQGCFRSKKG